MQSQTLKPMSALRTGPSVSTRIPSNLERAGAFLLQYPSPQSNANLRSNQSLGENPQGVGFYILLTAAGVASAMKFAQGSGTVAMTTTAAMFAAMELSPEVLGCNTVYLALAIGSGSLVGDWMNDSGFWIFSRMSGLTEVETLKSWTILTALLGCVSLGITLLLAHFVPML